MKTRVAIVGAGPAGFFAAQAIFAKDETATVDLFEKLPTPWGLVRSGVAPDHPKIRTVSKVFEKILDDPRCRYFGNVEIGKDFSISQLHEKYDAVIFASGADIGRKLGIPGEELMGVHSAAEFVPWYNAHPDFADFKVDLSGTHAIVIGAGNVAMDVGRLLAVTPDELASTDIADHALEALRKSSIRKTMIVARRGPEHAAFTSPELRDLLDLEHTDVLVNAELVQQAIDRTQIWEEIPKDVRQNLEAFQNLSSIVPQDRDRELSINFLLAPIEILGDTKVSGVRFSINKIEGAEVIPTGETVDHPADIVISAVGYTSCALDGLPVINGKIRNLDGRITDLRRFASLGEEGVDLFLVDSTNADVPGFTPSEREILPVLDRVFRQTKRRVIVASFASHVHRVQQVIDLAEQHKRKVCFIGRSMVRNMDIADRMGYLNIPAFVLIEKDDLDKFGDNVVLICTGSQGEPLAALSRMAYGEHSIVVGEGDTVVLASSLIPGNESPVYRVINELTRLGAKVVHKGNAMVHVSGHAAAGELLYCYNLVKPKNVMPVHGEWRHMKANAELAIQTGVKRNNTVVVENGMVVDLIDGRAQVVGAVPCGFVYVDSQSIGEITETTLKDRRILGEEGFISVVVVIDAQKGTIVAGPDIHARGFAEDVALFDEVKGRIEKALANAVADGVNGTHQLSQIMRKTVGSWVGGEHRRRPMIVPVVIEV